MKAKASIIKKVQGYRPRVQLCGIYGWTAVASSSVYYNNELNAAKAIESLCDMMGWDWEWVGVGPKDFNPE